MKRTLFIFSIAFSFSFINKENQGSIEIFKQLIPTAHYILQVEITEKTQTNQWTKGYTDYEAHGVVLTDYKDNYTDQKFCFHHRADGKTLEESKANQLKVGETYVILASDQHLENLRFVKNEDEVIQMTENVYILEDTYNSVQPHTEQIESLLSSISIK
jgi:hypothetical protein